MGAGAPGANRLPASAEPRASVAGSRLGTGLRRGQGRGGRVQGVQGSQLALEVHNVLRSELAGWDSWKVQGAPVPPCYGVDGQDGLYMEVSEELVVQVGCTSNFLSPSPQVLKSPTTSALRSGALSPQQGLMCSKTDAPYISYTARRPIGKSPQGTPVKLHGGRLARSLPIARLTASIHNTLVTVSRAEQDREGDRKLARLQDIPTFLPVMQIYTY